MSASPPGWLPDPTGRFQYRWFNGERWTADVAIDGQRSVDPIGAGFAPAAPGSANRPGRGLAIAGFVVAAAAVAVAWLPFLFVLGGVAAIVALVFSIIGWRRARGFAIAGVSLALLALGLTVVGYILTLELLEDIDDLTDVSAREVAIDRCDSSDGLTIVDGHIRNLDDREHSYILTIDFTIDDEVVATRTLDVNTVDAGASEAFHLAEFIDGSNVECSVTDVSSGFLGFP